MISIIEQNIKKKRSNFLKSNLNEYKIDENQIIDYTKHLWFKGSRYR